MCTFILVKYDREEITHNLFKKQENQEYLNPHPYLS